MIVEDVKKLDLDADFSGLSLPAHHPHEDEEIRSRILFLRSLGLIKGPNRVTALEIEHWRQLVDIDVTTAQLDQYACNALYELKLNQWTKVS